MIGLRGGISIAIVIILCSALAVIGWGAEQAAQRTIAPEIVAKANSVGRAAADLVQRAAAVGVPFDRLVGVNRYFDDLRAANIEFTQISLNAAGGKELARSGEASPGGDAPRVFVPVEDADGHRLGDVMIVVDPSVVSQQVGAVLVDVAFIGIVALLVALELVALVVGTRGLESLVAVERRLKALKRGVLSRQEGGAGAAGDLILPIDRHVETLAERHLALRAEAERRGDGEAIARLDEIEVRTGLGRVQAAESEAAIAVRPALFLFMLAEELTRPFLPRAAQALGVPAGFGPDMSASLPIVAFMAVVALCQVPFASLSERLGRRPGFLAGAALAAAGYVVSAISPHYDVFLAARVATAVGYALVFVSAQGHVVDLSSGAARSAALAVFVRAIMVASLCGPPIGGVIADRLGPGVAFGTSAGLALVALLVARLTLPAAERHRSVANVGLADLKAAARAPGLMSLLLGCAFPAKFLFAALCFLLVPLELQREGFSSAAIGRFQMIYPVLMVIGVPFFAALADRFSARAGFVVAGGLVSGIGAMAVLLHPSVALIVVALVALGWGQAMSIASQSALVADTATSMGAGRAAGVLGLFRLVERSGNAAGPASAGFLLSTLGFASATGFLGAVAVAGAVLFALSGRRIFVHHSRRPSSAAASEGSSA
ncbi:MAG: MFS transporter [Rhizobiales bacterium]|uniref:MFS transporter n=1 Tax=Xanthobacter TaxID=279 RepID=UPI001ACA0D1A|nr:MFS transporter [Xanthobacter autotrophicus]MBN8918801.1 MFS transporter [Hyphomicrobiales bacterium]UDQ91439.1 MFS transporter [Xanthobacter autotrophicus]